MKKYIALFLNDILMLIGVIFIIAATYRINTNAGLYVTGVFFMLVSLLLSIHPKKRG
jgi:hypothetical protein